MPAIRKSGVAKLPVLSTSHPVTNTPTIPGSVAKVLLIPQITSAKRGAISKELGAKPARPNANDPVAQHISTAPAVTEPAPVSLRTNVALRPERSRWSAQCPATLAIKKHTSHGAAESRPALAILTLKVVL